MQLNHYTTTFKEQQFPIVLVCNNVANAPNIGSLFRTADAFGIEKIIFCGTNIPLGRKMTKTSRSTEKYVNHKVQEDISEVVTKLKRENYHIISLEITTNSEPVHNTSFLANKPMALIIGDENFGVSEAILQQSDTIIHVDMFGKNSSMNVVQATSIALYEITKQIR